MRVFSSTLVLGALSAAVLGLVVHLNSLHGEFVMDDGTLLCSAHVIVFCLEVCYFEMRFFPCRLSCASHPKKWQWYETLICAPRPQSQCCSGMCAGCCRFTLVVFKSFAPRMQERLLGNTACIGEKSQKLSSPHCANISVVVPQRAFVIILQ
jgi:hypothetical protein